MTDKEFWQVVMLIGLLRGDNCEDAASLADEATDAMKYEHDDEWPSNDAC